MKRILIVVDMQNDFVTGSLGSPFAQSIVPAVDARLKEAHDAGDMVIFTRDTHDADYLGTQEGKNLPVEHCIKKSRGWEIIDQLKPHVNIIGDTFDKESFGSIDLAAYIKRRLGGEPVEEIELAGLCTDICVISNALILKAAFPETLITVNAVCCAGVTKESHDLALKAMKACQVNIIGE